MSRSSAQAKGNTGRDTGQVTLLLLLNTMSKQGVMDMKIMTSMIRIMVTLMYPVNVSG